MELLESRSIDNSQYNRILDQTITLFEIKKVVKAIKSNKSPGSDGILGELIKYRVQSKVFNSGLYKSSPI